MKIHPISLANSGTLFLTGQNLYFYYNHPIRFVCLAGIIVAREDYPRRTVLVLDDSSGATIEVIVLKTTITSPSSSSHHDGSGEKKTPTATVAGAGAGAGAGAAETVVHVTSTTRSPLDITTLIPGTVVKLKGTLSAFRSIMQLVLERYVLLPDTNAEIRFWDERTRYLVDVLSVPWSLSHQEIAQLRQDAEKEERKIVQDRRRAQEKKKKLVEREERDRRRIQRRWEREEKLRETQASVCREENRKLQEKMKRKD
jgi:hypothetical protein